LSGNEQKRSGNRPWQRWAFAAVPAAGILELGAHVAQTASVVPARDWQAARAYVASQSKPEDLVAFAPRWADPIGREELGPSLATIAREARPDETGFPRAFEVAIRGAHVAALSNWHRASEERFGGVTVTTWENPSPAHVLEDLVSDAEPAHLRVSRVEGGQETDCPPAHGAPQSGGLGSGTPLPADRFMCPGGGFVASSILEDANYYPRRCIYAPPFGGKAILRLRFLSVRFGHVLHGYHSLYVEAEHNLKAPVSMTFTVDGAVLGRVVHRDLEGWKPFEFDTGDRAGSAADLVADIESDTGERRMYCFEADTR
jgi:hypothetical protein